MELTPAAFVDEARASEGWGEGDWSEWLRIREAMEQTWHVGELALLANAPVRVAAYHGLQGIAFGKAGDDAPQPVRAALADLDGRLGRQADDRAARIAREELGLDPERAFLYDEAHAAEWGWQVVEGDDVLGRGPTKLHAALDAKRTRERQPRLG